MRQIVFSQCLAQPMAMSLAIVGSCGEQAASIMGQTSRCCVVCLMPQSHVSCSLENHQFNMLNLDRPTSVRNRLSAFRVVQGLSAPGGKYSSALMLRCTLASMISSRSLHSSMRAAFAVVLMGSVHLMKLFRDCRRGTTPRCPLSGCLWSVVCRVRSVRLATALLVSDGTIVERGSSVVECRIRNSVSPGSNPPLVPFGRLGIFLLSIDAPVDSAV